MRVSKIVRVISYSLFGLIILFIFFDLMFNYYVNQKLSPRLKEEFSKSTNYTYSLCFDKLCVNLFSKSISLSNVLISPFGNRKNTSMQIVFNVKYFKINDFSLLDYFRDRKLEINTIKFIDPRMSIYINDSLAKPKAIVIDGIDKYIKRVSIDHIDIVNYNVYAYHLKSDRLPFFEAVNSAMSLKYISINFETDRLDSFFIMKDANLVLNSFRYCSSDSLYTLSGSRLYASLAKSILVADSLFLLPNYSKNVFADKAKFQASRIKIISSKIKAHDVDYRRLFAEHFISTKKISFMDCFLDVYRDNTKPLERVNKLSLQALLKSVPFLFSVDTINVKNGRIDFEALQPSASSTGKIFVDKVYLNAFALCNDSSKIDDTNFIKADFGGYVLGKAKFTESYVFPMNCNGETFSCSGSLSAIPLSAFNPIVKPAKHILFKDGQLDNVVFSFDAKEKFSTGVMTFKYHDLKIEVLNRRNTKGGLKPLIKTLVLNNFKINKSNPSANEKTRTVKLFVKNNPYRYFFFYSMQTILSGIEPTILKSKK